MTYAYWVGMNTPADADAAALDEFNHFYNTVHLGEVIARHGFKHASRYELLNPDPRGDFGPRWLAIYEMDKQTAEAYIARNGAPARGQPAYTSGPPLWRAATLPWRLFWRQISVTGEAEPVGQSIFVVGMNVPPNTTDADLADFNAFYTNIHVPEVMERGAFERGTRFELYREFRHPAPGAPRFCARYDAPSEEVRRLSSGGPMTSGPPAWEQHDTLWRLTYRRIIETGLA